ncbi:hypothetical protein L0B53_03405 [Vibrio sp. SS-MA-C1-2]|uniref:hypothetical protein n=1 Tax=Vibrio sp. SS-MA-C1-2 TaxID=2908646 RepID=UPI001F1FA526|nr:hypothetical protein [Vibrio sp. SS-MA-C1-2]UJF17001.1 hypothetical protein L0B53_03405 [Vibrio sp. SS-MA-C1-2]
MFNEVQSLVKEFPNHKNEINHLLDNDQEFVAASYQYILISEEVHLLETLKGYIQGENLFIKKLVKSMLKNRLFNNINAIAA